MNHAIKNTLRNLRSILPYLIPVQMLIFGFDFYLGMTNGQKYPFLHAGMLALGVSLFAGLVGVLAYGAARPPAHQDLNAPISLKDAMLAIAVVAIVIGTALYVYLNHGAT